MTIKKLLLNSLPMGLEGTIISYRIRSMLFVVYTTAPFLFQQSSKRKRAVSYFMGIMNHRHHNHRLHRYQHCHNHCTYHRSFEEYRGIVDEPVLMKKWW